MLCKFFPGTQEQGPQEQTPFVCNFYKFHPVIKFWMFEQCVEFLITRNIDKKLLPQRIKMTKHPSAILGEKILTLM
jgi:hypothetical protein